MLTLWPRVTGRLATIGNVPICSHWMVRKDVLIMSPQRMPAQGDNYRNLHSTVYMMGTLDEDQGVLKNAAVRFR